MGQVPVAEVCGDPLVLRTESELVERLREALVFGADGKGEGEAQTVEVHGEGSGEHG